MKTVLLFSLLSTASLIAQIALPTTPTKFGTRSLNGGSGSGNASVNATTPPSETKARLVSYFSLDTPRQWKSSDGRSLIGNIIAYEESVVEVKAANAGAAAAAAQNAPAPKRPDKFTIVRDDKVRLLVNQKAVEVALSSLSEEDRQYVAKMNEALAKQQAAAK